MKLKRTSRRILAGAILALGFRYLDAAKVSRAVVDPGGKIVLDVDPANNSWTDEKGVARRAARKWSARFLLWLQNPLELHTVLA